MGLEDRPRKLPNNSVVNQEQLAAQMNISVDTLQNYKLLADIIPELEELMDTGIVTKTTALAMMRNLSEEKQRKAIAEYVELCGYKHGGDRNSNGLQDHLKITQEEIAKEFGISEKKLRRILSIERNLSKPMKELFYTGVITKNLAADTITSLSEEEQLDLISKLDVTQKYTTTQINQFISEIKSLKEENQKLKNAPEDFAE